jgi:predicted AlkP superfamily phosphohydrolase/phosphomutase/tetratricopeptide (TPR) repeat protein
LRLIAIVIILAVVGVLVVTSVKMVGDDEVALTGEGPGVRELKPGFNLLRPFTSVRKYRLNQEYVLTGDKALTVRLSARRHAAVEGTVELALARDRVLSLDGQYGEQVFDRLVRPILARELVGLLRDRVDASPQYLDTAASSVRDVANEKTRPLGIDIVSIRFEGVSESRMVAHDLERSDGVKVFILGLDGYDWMIADRVLDTHSLKNIERIRREGTWGNLRSVEPLISPLIWTTMVTGVSPDVHGITDFLVRDEDTGEDIPITSSLRRVPALWNITSLFEDLTCGFIGWFASFPAEEVEGFIVSDRFAYHMFDPAWRHGEKRASGEGQTYPPGLYDEIDPLKVKPEDINDDLNAYINGPIGALRTEFDPTDIDSNLRLVISAYRTYEKVMGRLYPDRRPDLFGIYFEFTDSVGHLLMKYMKPGMAGISPEDEERYGHGMAAAYSEADRIIGDVLEMIDDSTVLLIVSDHGFKSGDMRPLSDSRMGFGQAIDWHRINGSIALYGSMVKPGYRLEGASINDVAPTILYLLGLPVDRKMIGKVLLDAFDDAWTGTHPVAYTDRYDSLVVRSEYGPQPSASDQALKDKLVSLGYVAGGNKSMVNLASFYHKSGKYAEALELWKQVVAEDPDDLGASIGLSNAYYRLGREDLAIRGLLEVLERDPLNLKALQSLSTIHIEQGRPAEALEYAERGLKVDSRDGPSYLNKGNALRLLGRGEEAAHAFRQAVQFAPDLAEAYANLAQTYAETRRPTQALEMARKAIELASGQPQIHYVLGIALSANRRNQEALEQFLDVIEMDRGFVPAYIAASRILGEQGKTDSVIALCTDALETPSQYSIFAHTIRGTAYSVRGDLDLGARDFLAALAVNEAYDPARVSLAKVYIQQGRRQEAAAELQRVLARNPNHAEARSLLQALGR